MVLLLFCYGVCGSESREEIKYRGGQHELDHHMHTSREERKLEIEVVRREHPFVVLLSVRDLQGGIAIRSNAYDGD